MAVERTRARTRKVSSAMQNSAHYVFVDRLGVDVVYGSAVLGQTATVMVSPLEGTEMKRIFTAKRILIAMGRSHFIQRTSRSTILIFSILKGCQSIKRIPKNALVVGGGAIGCEFASIFTAFGIPVTVVQSGNFC